jgi:hypothetical protein
LQTEDNGNTTVNMKKEIRRKRETSNNHRSLQMQQKSTNHSMDKDDKLTKEKVIKDIRQKEREHELLKVNPEDTLNEEERRTNPLCLEE